MGVRYVDTTQASNGFVKDAALNFIVEFNDEVGYDSFLPSFNVAVDLADDVILRVAASQVMARVNYSDLKPGLAIDANFGTATGGNTSLKPYESDQFDVAVEWYYSDASMASAAIFNKEISNVVFVKQGVETVTGCGVSEADWSSCRVTRPRNGGDGSVTGMELQLQHIFDNGFGFITNYTYVDSESSGPDAKSMIPGVSENSFNGSLFFENDLFSTRLSYNWRDEWIGVGAAQAILNGNYTQVDASVTWHALENLDITIEGTNLTNEVIQSTDKNYALTYNTIEFGSRYYLSASYKF